MTKTQEQIAEAAARKMLEQHYLTVGYDITDPDDVLRLQADMLHLRTVRDITSKMGMRAVLTATYYSGDGNQKGTAVGEDGEALPRRGYSVFGELHVLPSKKVSLVLRYDRFDPDETMEDNENDRYIAGLAWDLGRHNTFLLDYDRVSYEDDRPDDNRVQLTLQIKF